MKPAMNGYLRYQEQRMRVRTIHPLDRMPCPDCKRIVAWSRKGPWPHVCGDARPLRYRFKRSKMT